MKNWSHPLLVIGAVHLKYRTPALCFSSSLTTKNIRPLQSVKVSGVTIASSVHCLAHDINICLLTFQFGRLTTGVPPFAPLVLHYVLQPRRHKHEGRTAVREGPDDPRPPPDLAVDALGPVARPDPVQRTRSQSLRLSGH